MPLSALPEAHEAFLTSSTREVHPIGEVNGNPLPQIGGPLTKRLAGLFRDLVNRESDPTPQRR
jgi:branched-chain amino acid aminotransferase